MHVTRSANFMLFVLRALILSEKSSSYGDPHFADFLQPPVISSLEGPSISSQHPVLKHSEPVFSLQYWRPSFTPVQNKILYEHHKN